MSDSVPSADWPRERLRSWLVAHGGIDTFWGASHEFLLEEVQRRMAGTDVEKKEETAAEDELVAAMARLDVQQDQQSSTSAATSPPPAHTPPPKRTIKVAVSPAPQRRSSGRKGRQPRTLLTWEELWDANAHKIRMERLTDHLRDRGELTPEAAQELLKRASNLMRTKPNVVRLRVATEDDPIVVCGDVHGQLEDMLTILEDDQVGGPVSKRRYLFLGDYVDRGWNGCGVVFVLYALKLNAPDRVHLLRGNHEGSTGLLSDEFGLECKTKYGDAVFEAFHESFKTIPIAALIELANEVRLLAMHGGMSPQMTSVADLDEKLDRFQTIETTSPITDLCAITWSDPVACGDAAAPHKVKRQCGRGGRIALDDDMGDARYRSGFAFNTDRCCGHVYSLHSVEYFLDKNGLACLLRAHMLSDDMLDDGFLMQWSCARERRASSIAQRVHHNAGGLEATDVDATNLPSVVTVFSAPDYKYARRNTAAVLWVTANALQIRKFSWEEQSAFRRVAREFVGQRTPEQRVKSLFFSASTTAAEGTQLKF